MDNVGIVPFSFYIFIRIVPRLMEWYCLGFRFRRNVSRFFGEIGGYGFSLFFDS